MMANRKSSKRTAKRATKRAAALKTQQSTQTGNPTTYQGEAISYVLGITLKSDLCPGSGDGFSSGVDTDVCYNAQGIPLIPGRRLKGCLRESACLLVGSNRRAKSVVDSIFGVAGASDAGALSITNAQLCGSRSYGTLETTLDRYTYTRAQTRINRVTGAAEDNTLRYVRVVKHYQEDHIETRFEADVILDQARFRNKEEARTARELLKDAALGLRNIGQSRNRGFGAVKCELTIKPSTAKERDAQLARIVSHVDASNVILSYRVRLESPLMLALQSGNRSLGYVPGTSVFGFFAHRMRARDDFDRIFLNGLVRFSPLYPVDEAGNRCMPAAPFIAKVKGGNRDGSLVNTLTYEQRFGETPKPLRSGFVSPDSWNPVEAKSEIVYHHSTGRDGTKATLYTQECLSAGQELAGFIECPEEYADVFKQELSRGPITFGRSKSAQYARCTLADGAKDNSHALERFTIVAGKPYALLFDSDALIVSEDGNYSADYATLKRELVKISDATGAWFKECDAEAEDVKHPSTNIIGRTITGYNAKWNQKKPHVRAIAAGSCIVFNAASSVPVLPAVMYIGERQAEGYGRLMLVDLAKVLPASLHGQCEEQFRVTRNDSEEARLSAIAYAEEAWSQSFRGDGLGSSFIGRLTLMVDESASHDELLTRFMSIKNDDKRDVAVSLVNELCYRLGNPTWPQEKECLQLLLTLEKYYAKQSKTREGSER